MHRLDRRALLATATTSLLTGASGCLGDAVWLPGRDDGTVSPARIVTIENVDEDPDPLAFEIVPVSETLSNMAILWMDIRVENVGETTASWEQRETDFAFPATGTTPAGLAIGTERKIEIMAEADEGCNRVVAIDKDDVVVTTELTSGESLTDRYGIVLADAHLDEPCPPTGVYRAKWEYDEHGTWGFEIDVAAA